MGTATGFQSAEGRAPATKKPRIDPEGIGHDRACALTVLVVDDQRDLADMAELLLNIHGFQVRVAYSATAALAILETDSTIDVLFSDILMPGMSGLELASIVGNIYPGVKIVLTSGYTSPTVAASYQAPKWFLTKPYSVHKLISILLA